MTQHNNMPIDSTDAGKLFIFALLVIPPTIFIVGIIPVLFLLFGILMLRKTRDFSHIETAARNYKIFCILALLCLAGIAGYYFLENYSRIERGFDSSYGIEYAIDASASSIIPLFYIFALQVLFLGPLRANRTWVIGKFFAARDGAKAPNSGEIDIIKGERLRSFSVADELLKWAKLKDEGHITEKEFSDARRKLLDRN